MAVDQLEDVSPRLVLALWSAQHQPETPGGGVAEPWAPGPVLNPFPCPARSGSTH